MIDMSEGNTDNSEINPVAIFIVMALTFSTVALIQHVFIIFSIWSLAIGSFLGYSLLRSCDEIPNLLLLLQITGTIKGPKAVGYNPTERKTSKGCGICNKKGCSRHKVQEDSQLKNPWEDLLISKTVDDALTEFFEIVLNTHMYSWYRDLSHDQGFVDEVRCALHQAASVIYRRLKTTKLSEFVIKRILTKFMVHVDCFFFVKVQINNKDELQQAVLDHLKTYKHFCVQNDTAEKEYLRYTIQTLLPYLIPKTPLSCRALSYFLEELSTCIMLKPLIERIVDPDFVNNLLLIFLDESTIPEPDYPRSEKVKFLEHFGKKRANYASSPLNIPVYGLIHDAVYLYPFMQFMKQEGALNILQFCLNVEEFNKRILAAELTESEEAQIIEEVREINDLYFKIDAIDKIEFPDDIIQDFQSCISSNGNKIDQTKAAAPLFRAYEHAVDILEKSYVPLFHQSDDMFAVRCGDRFIKVKKTTEEINLAKRKFMPFADLSKITSKIRAKKLRAKSGELTFMDEFDYPMEEAYEAYDSYDDDDDNDDEEGECNVDNFDLNYCHITIPRMDFVLISNKRCYVYILTVEQIGEQSQWQVVRKYNEFYVLDSKLRRFHGTLNNAELPPKRTIFKKDFEYLNSIRPKLQEYLQHLARSPVLSGSSLLQRFLTPGHEIDGMFEPDSVGREAGRKVKSLQNKLVTEKGQNLEVFLNSFVSSAEPSLKKKLPPKPITSHMYSSHRRHDSLISLPPPHWARELRRSLSSVSFSEYSVSQFLLYSCRNFFKVPSWVHHFLIFLQYACKNTIDVFAERFIAYKISLAVAERQMVSYIQLIRDVIFFNNDAPRTDSDKVERRDKVFEHLLNYFPRGLKDVIGVENHDHAMKTLLEMFQYPQLNKHLFYILFDELLYELFPEIKIANDDKM